MFRFFNQKEIDRSYKLIKEKLQPFQKPLVFLLLGGDNKRYKPIILGKNGNTIKRIRECSQKDIKSIINNNIHLYLQIDTKNAK